MVRIHYIDSDDEGSTSPASFSGSDMEFLSENEDDDMMVIDDFAPSQQQAASSRASNRNSTNNRASSSSSSSAQAAATTTTNSAAATATATATTRQNMASAAARRPPPPAYNNNGGGGGFDGHGGFGASIMQAMAAAAGGARSGWMASMRSGINPNSTFSEQFHAYPVAMYPGKDMEHLNLSGRILMPPSSLHILSHMNIEMPMKFELTNVGISSKTTHAGVLEFIAEEGKVYLPQWMMRSLLLTPGAIVRVRNVDMGLGDFIKLEPQSVAFLDISDARAVLERALREYTTMTVGDVFPIKYGDIQFDMKVLETRARGSGARTFSLEQQLANTANTDGNVGRGTGISVVETDLQVDFAPPVGYVEPQRPSTPAQSTPGTSRPGSRMAAGSGMDISHAVVEPVQKWSPFQGAGTSLRPPSAAPSRPFKRSPLANSTPSNKGSEEPTEPDAESVKDKTPKPIVLRPGELYFGWSTPVIVAGDDGKDNKEASTDSPESAASSRKSEAFTGAGATLRRRKDQRPSSTPSNRP